MKKKNLISIIVLCAATLIPSLWERTGITLQAQNVGINATGALPDNSAGLDVDFTNKGLLIPRVSLTGPTDNTTISNPATSLLVYNTANAGGLTPGYYYNAGTPASPNWVRLLNGGTPGDAWLLNGNAGTTAGTHFLGTTDNVDLVFKTNNIERARILSNGRIGINTSIPGSYYLDVLSNNSSIDAIRGQHTSGTTTSVFAAVTGSVSNGAYITSTGHLAYHNSNNKTFGVYGNGGDLAGMFNGKVGINTVSTDITGYDLEIRNNTSSNPAKMILRQTTSNTLLNSILGDIDFGDNYNQNAQAKIRVIRDAASSSATDLPTAITLWTTSDGTNTLIERMRVTNQGNVGIGTTSPAVKLEVANPVNTEFIRLNNGTTAPFQILFGNNLGNESNAQGVVYYEIAGDESHVFGGYVMPDADGTRTLGKSTHRWSAVWALNGTIQTSDEKEKENIASLNYGLKEITQLNPITFKWKKMINHHDFKIGLSAQELEKIIPEVVVRDEEHPEAPLGVMYSDLIPVLINAIKELKAENDKKDAEIEILNNEINKIKALMGIKAEQYTEVNK